MVVKCLHVQSLRLRLVNIVVVGYAQKESMLIYSRFRQASSDIRVQDDIVSYVSSIERMPVSDQMGDISRKKPVVSPARVATALVITLQHSKRVLMPT